MTDLLGDARLLLRHLELAHVGQQLLGGIQLVDGLHRRRRLTHHIRHLAHTRHVSKN